MFLPQDYPYMLENAQRAAQEARERAARADESADSLEREGHYDTARSWRRQAESARLDATEQEAAAEEWKDLIR